MLWRRIPKAQLELSDLVVLLPPSFSSRVPLSFASLSSLFSASFSFSSLVPLAINTAP